MNEWMNEWMNESLFILSCTTFINDKCQRNQMTKKWGWIAYIKVLCDNYYDLANKCFFLNLTQ